MKRILVLNLGSTSFKLKLYEMDGATEDMLATGHVESIGGPGTYKLQAGGQQRAGECAAASHMDALALLLNAMDELGLSIRMETLDAIGYKAVHGGNLSGALPVDEALLAEMERMVPFAPAHNTVYLRMMCSIREKYPQAVQIACFETAFHATVPPERVLYGVPREWADKLGIRRYGFHGSSHSYIAWKMARLAPEKRRVISAHLGGSSSLCAIQDGRSIATTMGATPQSGLFQNNRVGDLDVFCLPALVSEFGSLENALARLACEGGLLGLSGVSGDLRAVEEAAAQDDTRAQLALEAFADGVAGYTGMLTAYLGGLDALVFTGGIGLNGALMRERIVGKLAFLQAKLDKAAPGFEGRVSAPDSGIDIWVLETNEELMVARGCFGVICA